MKKVFSIILCLLLAAALAVPVFADGSASFSMSASSKTLYHGDTVTLTVSASSSAEATSYGLKLSYNSDVFELVSGNTAASGALLNSFKNGFAFMFQSPTAYSGSVGTVTLRVKENVPEGSYTISGNASVLNGTEAVSASGCSVSITVSCHHSYGAWVEGDGVCQQTCGNCGDVQTAEHQWEKDANSVDATCKEDGMHYFTCAVCGAQKSEVDPKTDDHTFGNLTAVDGNDHKDICSVCQKEITEAHTWDGGKVTKPATCKEEGVKTTTCTGCQYSYTEVILLSTTHTWSKWEKVDAETHKRVCTVCQLEETGDHGYKTSWSKDRNEHWHECADCKDKKDAAAHTPGAEATETTAQTCTVCNYIIKAALGHTHDYAEEWTTDEAGHWYTCAGCEEKGEYADHDFENDCDPDCSICGYVREAGHTFGTEWVTDGENHWHECTICGELEGEEAHTPGAEATETTAQVCTVCDYEIAPALGVQETEPQATEPDAAATEPVSGNDEPKDGFPWWIILVAVVVIGGVVFFIVKKRVR